ncbi:unnamed protein product [Durusdinium trenchii]|uniref:Uncharacterized protein n=1 Tax=Durusdinium trenchii TaxID=1381693 RepID=A0ABP0K1X5_9DINO
MAVMAMEKWVRRWKLLLHFLLLLASSGPAATPNLMERCQVILNLHKGHSALVALTKESLPTPALLQQASSSTDWFEEGNYELRLDELDGIQPPAQERAEAQGLLPIGGATGTFCVPGDAVGRDWPVPATLTWIPWAVEANERPESVWPPTAGTNPAKKKLHLKRQSQPGVKAQCYYATMTCNQALEHCNKVWALSALHGESGPSADRASPAKPPLYVTGTCSYLIKTEQKRAAERAVVDGGLHKHYRLS